MKTLSIIVVTILFIAASFITYDSLAADVATCEVKTMCVVACGAGYVKCSGKKCEKGKDFVVCDGNKTYCCGTNPQ